MEASHRMALRVRQEALRLALQYRRRDVTIDIAGKHTGGLWTCTWCNVTAKLLKDLVKDRRSPQADKMVRLAASVAMSLSRFDSRRTSLRV